MTKHFATFASAALVAGLLAVPAVAAQGRGRGGFDQQQQQQQQAAQQPAAGAANANAYRPPPPEEKSVVTHHDGKFGGNAIKYTATAATYVIKADDGQPKATFFFTAYTRDGVEDMVHRPLTFVFNGGPGSASMWTHMGLGPRRVVLTDDGQGMPAPYSTVENGDCVLDATDMVFVDAIGTGYSRPAPGENPTQFYGVAQDAQYFADFIWQYVTRTQRWASPKFLLGESYGTTRSAMLAGTLLQRRSMFMSGVMLLSAVGFGNFGSDDRFAFELPSYVTSAWYHHLLAPDLQNLSIDQVAQKARDFAHGEYRQALEKGDEMSAAEKAKVVADIAHYTGLSKAYVEESNLRISPQRWFKELLRSKRQTMGRLDARFTGQDYDAAGEGEEYDPSWATYTGAYAAMWQDYVRRDLNWVSDGWYNVSGNVRPWDNGQPGQPAESLRAAMTQEKHLKLMVMAGYYDHATPFNGIEHTVSHMSLEPNIRKNVSFVYYETGHMVYIDKKAREKMRKDVIGFINMASKQAPGE